MNKLLIGLSISIMTSSAYAEEVIEKEVQDMSDPLAVYTQVGGGITDAGLNLKLGQTYDTNNPETMGMNIIEGKGLLAN
ncbi:hypothetical protein [Shewanella sp. 10N.286.51.B7]|uniref:hypothetical protein n=1 Tax=Shewanella sp. 10N.286.51.B7 TaxID=1880836 RepID=UPI0018E44733|nr:hypothetical protein [Shewanella sp. 10N.286.51.B7]